MPGPRRQQPFDGHGVPPPAPRARRGGQPFGAGHACGKTAIAPLGVLRLGYARATAGIGYAPSPASYLAESNFRHRWFGTVAAVDLNRALSKYDCHQDGTY